VKVSEREQVIEVTLAALARRPAAYPQLVFTSSQTGEGITQLRAAIAQLLHERNA
jgi:GTP-binding protein